MGHKIHYVRALALWAGTLGRRSSQSFTFADRTYAYFHHSYNLTWLNERCVEIPIIRDLVQSAKNAKLLEIGHVLRHYDTTLTHPVVDRYEASDLANLFQEDAETFRGTPPYDLIVSVSTLEHVGWDESPRDEDKIRRTLSHLRELLSPTGQLIFTAPIAYSPPLDKLIDEGEGLIERRCLQRINARNEWMETDWETIRNCQFHKPYPFANGLAVCRMKSLP